MPLMKSGVRQINEICKDYIDENGYSIFECAEKFDFILIDPFSDLLRDDLGGGVRAVKIHLDSKK